MNYKRLAAGLILLILLAAVLLPHLGSMQSRQVVHQHQQWPGPSADTPGMDIYGNLTTHLPLIILKTQGQVIPGAEERTEEDLYCEYAIIQNENGVNRSDDTPTQTGRVALSIRGNSSRDYRKKQYAVKLVDQTGLPVKESLLGMPAESTWVLNGSVIDHAQIRNYMMCNLAGEIMGYAPRCRLAEVMLTDSSGNLLYQGLYTLMEKPKVSENRLNLTPYDPRYAETAFLLQMNNYHSGATIPILKPDDILAVCETGLIYPATEDISQESLSYIAREMMTIEKVLYDAYYTKDWSKLDQYINLDSFVDYYILNEFFQNYDAGRRSTYLYKDLGGLLSIGPVWDWDSAFNNFGFVEMTVEQLEMKRTYFYYYLSQCPQFGQRLAQRYTQLRRHYLSEEYLLEYIDSTIAYLDSALSRDSGRWNPDHRDVYLEDIEKMRDFVIRRGAWMDTHFADYVTVIEERFDT